MIWSVILEELLREEKGTVTESICPRGKLGSSWWPILQTRNSRNFEEPGYSFRRLDGWDRLCDWGMVVMEIVGHL